MRITQLAFVSLGAASMLFLATACSSQSSSGEVPAVQATAGMDDYFDNNPNGENVLDVLTGGYPDSISGCSGTVGYNPVFITNTTDKPQTVTYTINSVLGNDVFVAGASVIAGTEGCGAFSGNVNNAQLVIQPGQTWSGGVLAAGNDGPDTNTMGSQHNLSIGGGDNNQWYDFWLHSGMGGGFENWELNYSNTGGTNPSQNLQAGLFNVMECNPTTGAPGTEFSITSTIVSNYSSNAPNAWTYNDNDPICLAFLNPQTDLSSNLG